MQLDDGPRDDLGELELDPGAPPERELDFESEPDEGPNWPLIWVVILLLVALVGVYFGFFRGRQKALEATAPQASEAPAAAPSVAEPAASEEPDIELPTLAASDAVVRELVSQLSDHPRLATWLAPDELVRAFVAAVDNIAEGKSPRTHLRALEPAGGFESVDKSGLTVVDSSSYRRYQGLAQLFESLDSADVASLYRTLEPLMAEAYRDLGYPSRDFGAVLARAVNELVATPLPSGDIALVPKVSSFEFADPSLEKLSQAQKHLLRMGPDNARRVQRKLAEIRDELGLEP